VDILIEPGGGAYKYDGKTFDNILADKAESMKTVFITTPYKVL
jgi:hypothetical protein